MIVSCMLKKIAFGHIISKYLHQKGIDQENHISLRTRKSKQIGKNITASHMLKILTGWSLFNIHSSSKHRSIAVIKNMVLFLSLHFFEVPKKCEKECEFIHVKISKAYYLSSSKPLFFYFLSLLFFEIDSII